MKLKISQLLHLMLSLTFAVDFINGIFPSLHIGEIFRVLLLLVCAWIISKKDKRQFKVLLGIISFLLINVMVSTLQNTEAASYDISIAMKSIMVFVISTTIIALYKCGTPINIGKIIHNNMIYGPGLFIISNLLGLGNSSYSYGGNSIGFKATFISLNTVNIALMIIYIFAVTNTILEERKQWKWIVISVYTALPMAMLGTKTSLAMILLVPLLIILLNTKRKRTWIIVGGMAIFSVIFGTPIINRILEILTPIIERQKYFYQERDLLTYLFSTRNLRVGRTFDYYIKNFNVLDIFPGKGYYGIHNYIGTTEHLSVIPIEMDWVDILVTYGPVGFLFTYVYSIKKIIKTRKIVKTKSGQPFILAAILILLFGTLAGHLFFEALSSTLYGVVLAGCYVSWCDNSKTLKGIK